MDKDVTNRPICVQLAQAFRCVRFAADGDWRQVRGVTVRQHHGRRVIRAHQLRTKVAQHHKRGGRKGATVDTYKSLSIGLITVSTRAHSVEMQATLTPRVGPVDIGRLSDQARSYSFWSYYPVNPNDALSHYHKYALNRRENSVRRGWRVPCAEARPLEEVSPHSAPPSVPTIYT